MKVKCTMKIFNLKKIILAAASLPLIAGCVERQVVYEPAPATAPPPNAVVEEAPAPPPPQVEVIPPQPDPTFIWVGGAWAWHGRWVWAGGHWGPRPHPGAIWVGGHWGYRGHHRVWVEGGWR